MSPLSDFLHISLISLNAMIPITLAAVGEVIGEKSGVINIGLEGIFLISAFTGTVGAEYFGAPSMGLAIGLLTGLIIGLLHGLLCTYLKGNHVISGVGINLLGAGLISFGIRAVWNSPAHVLSVTARMPQIDTGYGQVSYLLPLTIAIVASAYYLLNRTKLGLQIKITGEHPRAADVAGVKVKLVRLLSTTCGACLAGLGGAFLSLDWFGVLTKEVAAGRGFIALATVVFSRLNPALALLGGLIFGFFDSLGIWVSSSPVIKKVIPWQFIVMLPYVVTLVAVAGVIGRARFPDALGEPYKRE